jgi:hypothetical protein
VIVSEGDILWPRVSGWVVTIDIIRIGIENQRAAHRVAFFFAAKSLVCLRELGGLLFGEAGDGGEHREYAAM